MRLGRRAEADGGVKGTASHSVLLELPLDGLQVHGSPVDVGLGAVHPRHT